MIYPLIFAEGGESHKLLAAIPRTTTYTNERARGRSYKLKLTVISLAPV